MLQYLTVVAIGGGVNERHQSICSHSIENRFSVKLRCAVQRRCSWSLLREERVPPAGFDKSTRHVCIHFGDPPSFLRRMKIKSHHAWLAQLHTRARRLLQNFLNFTRQSKPAD